MSKYSIKGAITSGMLAVGAFVGVTAAVVAPATPASAACSTVVQAQYNSGSTKAWKLAQSSDCTQRWGQIVIDYVSSPFDVPLVLRTERLIKSPYGYVQDTASTKRLMSGQGVTGVWNTTRNPNSSGDGDKHRICYGYASGSPGAWTYPSSWSSCTAWVY
ncbi:hypothetical protein AB0L34_31595 [Micromonospora sp. NPDC052213]|uniref:hypothetical protein n=1 Tax=Micromonospora sp. NPDC052213 TaxID=3155812 RepID=UPI00341F84A8